MSDCASVPGSDVCNSDIDDNNSDVDDARAPRAIGKKKYDDGSVYEGEIKTKLSGIKAHGEGTLTHRDGSTYTGQFVSDRKCGQGTLTTRTGNCYEGSWLDNLAHGTGRIEYSSGLTYDGQWIRGEIEGFGTAWWSDGTIYE